MLVLDEGREKMEERTFRLDSFSSEKLADGRQVVAQSPQGTKILAYVENGKIAGYEAEDSSGDPRPVFLVKRSAQVHGAGFDLPSSGIWDWACVLDDVMMYCVKDPGGSGFIPPGPFE